MIALMAISAEKSKHKFSAKKDDDNGNENQKDHSIKDKNAN